jgi:hypothetical protein
MHIKHACVIWFCSFSYINIFLYLMRGFPLKLLQRVLEVLLKCWMQWVSILSTLYLFTFKYKISNVNITCTNFLISMDHDWFLLDYPYVVWIGWTNLCSNIYILLLFSHRWCYKQNRWSIPCSRTCCIFKKTTLCVF